MLGTDPLDKAFTGERSYLRIGNRNKIREHYTISRGTRPETVTEIGDENYVMTSGHIAHNCRIGSGMIIFPGRMVESDVILVASPGRRVISRNVTYEESDHHQLDIAGSAHQRQYPRLDEKEETEAAWNTW